MALTKHKRFFFCLFIDHGGAHLTQTFSSLSTRFKSRAIQSGIRQPLPDGRLISAIYLHRKEGKKKEQKKRKNKNTHPSFWRHRKEFFSSFFCRCSACLFSHALWVFIAFSLHAFKQLCAGEMRNGNQSRGELCCCPVVRKQLTKPCAAA